MSQNSTTESTSSASGTASASGTPNVSSTGHTNDTSSGGTSDDSSARINNSLCNSSISNANASGFITYNPDDYYVDRAPKHSWAVTITGGDGEKIRRQFWYDTAGENYADDLALGMDVCAFPNFEMPLNAHRLGKHDPGNCSTVFTQHCIDSVRSAASESALKWVKYSSPPPYENLTAGVLPSICRYISSDIHETVKKECGPQVRPDDGTSGGFEENGKALTGYNSSTLYYNNCTLSAGNRTLHPAGFSFPVNPEWDTGSDVGFANITNAVTPILTVYMPVANIERQFGLNEWFKPKSVLECIRASNFSAGSKIVPTLTEGTPWPKPGLSAGAKGGIAAGVVVFVLTVGGLLLTLWLIKRKKRARAAAAAAAVAQSESTTSDDKKLPPEADGGFSIHELTPDDRKPEIGDSTVSELGGGNVKPSELANTLAPVELSAENPRVER